MKANIHGRTPVVTVWSTKSIENKRTRGGVENQCIHRDKDTVHFKRICTRIYLSQNCLYNVVLNMCCLFQQMLYNAGHIKGFFSNTSNGQIILYYWIYCRCRLTALPAVTKLLKINIHCPFRVKSQMPAFDGILKHICSVSFHRFKDNSVLPIMTSG